MNYVFLGSWNVSFIVSSDGRSRREDSVKFIDTHDNMYNYQTYAGMC